MPVKPAQRKRPLTTFTLSVEAIGAVEALAELWGVSKSAAVERVIREEARRRGLDLKELGQKVRRRRARAATGSGGKRRRRRT